jgi:SlyX protein
MSDLEEQLIDIETRLAYQEDTIAQLNDVITKQDADIIQMTQQLRLLAKRFDDLQYDQADAGGEITNDRPPHY